MSRSVDLDAIRAETEGDPIEVKVGGVAWQVLPAMPWEATQLWRRGEFREAFAMLPVDIAEGQKFADAIMGDRLSSTDLRDRLDAIFAQDTGESSAS